MLVFPQLSTGCIAQFPIRRRQSQRTLLNETTDGRQVRMADPDAATVRWELKYVGLTDDEKQRIEDLFVATEGRLRSFAFLDPTVNLLAKTEDLSAPAWNKAPLLSLTSGAADPFGGDCAWNLQNAGPTPASISQTMTCPGAFQYCVSAYVRAAQSNSIDCKLRIRTAAGEVIRSAGAGPDWNRVHCAGNIPDSPDAVTFGLEIPGERTMDIYGLQVDAQPFPSPYKSSVAGGVYLNTRFEEDVLQVRTEGVNSHSITLRLTSRANR